MDKVRISTITAVCELSNNINLQLLYNKLQINDTIKYIEYGNIPGSNKYNYKGYSVKNKKKTRKKNKRNIFFNQATIHLYLQKLINVKVFNNGKIQMTGLNNKTSITDVIHEFINQIELYDKNIFIYETEYSSPRILNEQIVLINSDFDIGFSINREKLYRLLIDNGYFCTFEPCQYPGINVKYYNNNLYTDGICKCTVLCNGKSNGKGNGHCKKITLAIFKSGKIIITGGQNMNQINNAYNFIVPFINKHKTLINN
tara:strand:+ start:122 stop:892 length:771 start_codon:yes stop_codon:yes gene_type:complete